MRILYLSAAAILLMLGMKGQSMLPHENHLPAPLTGLMQSLDLPPVSTWEDAKNTFSRYARKPGQERWELPALSFSREQTERIKQDLKELGFISATVPKKTTYDYAIVLGAAMPTMIARFNYLIAQWQAGVRFKQLVFLTGQRPLVEKADDFQRQILVWARTGLNIKWTDKNLPQSESEAARIIYATGALPEELRKVPVIFNSAPRQWLADAHAWQRPSTITTINSWLKQENPTHGSVLIVSSQPSALYQDQVFRNTLPEKFALDTIALECHKSVSLPVMLDAVWLWLKNKVCGIEP